MDNTIYMYPMRNTIDLRKKNPYVYHLCSGLLDSFSIVNYGKDIKGGILDVLKYIFRCRILYFNWVESMPATQVPFFLLIFLFSKCLNKRIIWTHHNVHPHKSDSLLSKLVMELLIKYADFIVIHTRESIPLLKQRRDQKTIVYFFHPFFVKNVHPSQGNEIAKEFDLLIWGNVRKSKGVELFLEYLKAGNLLNKYSIKVIGRFESSEYYKNIASSYSSSTLSIENGFISDDELRCYHRKSRFIFFPYTGSSVLNSGALITSLPFDIPIIGPRVGAFKELSELGYIYSYDSFSDVLKYLDTTEVEHCRKESELVSFIQEHTWKNFAEYFRNNIYN